MKRLFVALIATISALAAVVAVPAPVGAQTTSGNSDVYVVHGIPGLDVDVYVNDALTLPAFAPETVAGPLSLPAADYEIEIFAATASPAASADARTDAAALSVVQAVPADANVSVVAHLDANGAPTLTPFVNDVSDVADAMTGRVVVRHTAAAPSVDIVAGGAPVGNLVDITNGEQEQIDLPAAEYSTGIAATGTTAVLFDAPVTVVGAEALIVYAIGDLAGGSFGLVTQSLDLSAAPTDTAQVKVVHGIPGLTVDIYVNGALTLPAFEPKTIAGPLTLPAGDYEIEIFVATPNPADTSAARTDAAALTVNPTVPAGADLSLVAHLDADGAPTVTAFVNDVSTLASGDQGRVVVRHTAAAPAVDIVAGGAPVGNLINISNGEQQGIDLPVGSYPTGIAAAGTPDALVDAPVTVRPGQGIVVYAIGDLAGGSFDLIVETIGGLALAPEFRGAEGSEGEIARLYLAMLSRTPDPAGFEYWVERRNNGTSLQRIVAEFNDVDEFRSRFGHQRDGTDEEWVHFVYNQILGRDAEPAGLAYWVERINTDLERHDLVQYFSESVEFRIYTGTN